MAAIRVSLLGSLLLVLSVAGWGQMNYSNNKSNTGVSIVNHLSTDCVLGQTNCWHAGPAGVFTKIRTSKIGALKAVDIAGHIWKYTDYPSTPAWTLEDSGTWVDLAIGMGGTELRLTQSALCSDSTTTPILQIGGTQYPSICFNQIDAGNGSMFTAVRTSTGLAYYSTNGTTWTQLPGTGWMGAYIKDSGYIVLLKASDGSLWSTNSLGATPVQFACCLIEAAVDMNGTVYGRGFGTSFRNTAYRFLRQSGYNGVWDTLIGTCTSLVAANPFNTWCLGNTVSGGNSYRLSVNTHQFSSTVSGSGTCTGCFVNGQCCPVTHSAYMSTYWYGASTRSSSGTFSATIGSGGGSFSGTQTSTLIDPFACFTDASCTPVSQESVSCSAMGPIQSDNGAPTFPWLTCLLHPIPPLPGAWKRGTTVTVYMANTYSSSDAGSVMDGITSWQLVNGISYPESVVASVPASPSYPYIWTHPNLGGSVTVQGGRSGRGHEWSELKINSANLGNPTYVSGAAVHEEGHDNGLNDCYSCPNDGTYSVMGGQNTDTDPAQPTFPQPCDVFWSLFYSAI